MIAMAIGSVISSYFPNLGMIAPLLAVKLITMLEKTDATVIIAQLNIAYVIAIAVACVVVFYKNTFIEYFSQDQDKKYSIVSIYDRLTAESFIKYMQAYSEMFSDFPNINIGNEISALSSNSDARIRSLSKGQTITIKDKNFNVNGYLQIGEFSKSISEKETVKVVFTKMYIAKSCGISAEQYLTKINERVIEDEKKSDNVSLYYIKVLLRHDGDLEHYSQPIFKGTKSELAELKKNIMNEFFHPDKEEIISQIYNTHENKSGQFSAIFHGPPGTGKSSLAYRTAIACERNIISIDLTALKYKTWVYRYLRTISIGGRYRDFTETIILLEEFDTVSAYLKKKNEIANHMKNHWMTQSVSSESTKTEKNKTTLGNPDEFNMRDLLEVLQGPVPMNGRIIIATTNKLSELMDECSALFRPGRLKPIEFGYLDYVQINKMVDYHFKNLSDSDREKLHIDFNPDIPTSQILDYIEAAQLLKNPNMFSASIKKHT